MNAVGFWLMKYQMLSFVHTYTICRVQLSSRRADVLDCPCIRVFTACREEARSPFTYLDVTCQFAHSAIAFLAFCGCDLAGPTFATWSSTFTYTPIPSGLSGLAATTLASTQ